MILSSNGKVGLIFLVPGVGALVLAAVGARWELEIFQGYMNFSIFFVIGLGMLFSIIGVGFLVIEAIAQDRTKGSK